MSDISITRFQPASVTREKVNAVTPAENESGGLGGGGHGGQHEHEHEHEHDRRSADASPEDAVSTEEKTSDDGLAEAVASLNAYVQRVQRDIIFDLEGDGAPSVTVVDRSSRKVLRHIDGEEARKLARRADDDEDLNLFDTRV